MTPTPQSLDTVTEALEAAAKVADGWREIDWPEHVHRSAVAKVAESIASRIRALAIKPTPTVDERVKEAPTTKDSGGDDNEWARTAARRILEELSAHGTATSDVNVAFVASIINFYARTALSDAGRENNPHDK